MIVIQSKSIHITTQTYYMKPQLLSENFSATPNVPISECRVHLTPKYHRHRTGAANLPQKGAGLAKGRSTLCANDHSVQGSAGAAQARVEEALLASVTLGARIKVPPPALPCPLPKDKYPRQVSTSSACSKDLQLQNFVGGQQLIQAVIARDTRL